MVFKEPVVCAVGISPQIRLKYHAHSSKLIPLSWTGPSPVRSVSQAVALHTDHCQKAWQRKVCLGLPPPFHHSYSLSVPTSVSAGIIVIFLRLCSALFSLYFLLFVLFFRSYFSVWLWSSRLFCYLQFWHGCCSARYNSWQLQNAFAFFYSFVWMAFDDCFFPGFFCFNLACLCAGFLRISRVWSISPCHFLFFFSLPPLFLTRCLPFLKVGDEVSRIFLEEKKEQSSLGRLVYFGSLMNFPFFYVFSVSFATVPCMQAALPHLFLVLSVTTMTCFFKSAFVTIAAQCVSPFHPCWNLFHFPYYWSLRLCRFSSH